MVIGLNQTISHCSLEYTEDELVYQQYTGLKNKNGKEIYEGDIVKVRYDNKWIINAVVEYIPCQFILRKDGLFYEINERCAFLEVLGNIFETPELLKVEII